jgi:hypothetical protein
MNDKIEKFNLNNYEIIHLNNTKQKLSDFLKEMKKYKPSKEDLILFDLKGRK